MVKVTDKDFYMDGWLQSNLDLMLKREKKGWDNFLIMDGTPGCGKSTLSHQIGYYLAHKSGKTFGVENVFFDVTELIEYFNANRKKIIIWDESAADGMAVDWQNKNQQKLVKMLYMARKFGHIIIFVIPEIRKLQYVFAGSRSLALIRVYSPDGLARGYFRLYNTSKKVQIYNEERAGKFWHKVHPDFFGRFANPGNYEELIDMKEYEKKKDKAIADINSESNKGDKKLIRSEKRLLIVLNWLIEVKKFTRTQIADVLGEDKSNFGGWFRRANLPKDDS